MDARQFGWLTTDHGWTLPAQSRQGHHVFKRCEMTTPCSDNEVGPTRPSHALANGSNLFTPDWWKGINYVNLNNVWECNPPASAVLPRAALKSQRQYTIAFSASSATPCTLIPPPRSSRMRARPFCLRVQRRSQFDEESCNADRNVGVTGWAMAQNDNCRRQ
jgi:hypothetical protein